MEWFLSSQAEDLPTHVIEAGGYAYRSLKVDDEVVDFSEGFNDLHTVAYRNILDGSGPSLADALPGIKLVHQIREGAK
jgi:UDP-N-acetyl-2-amino-2-deoxyglucuronate dehydrogenase